MLKFVVCSWFGVFALIENSTQKKDLGRTGCLGDVNELLITSINSTAVQFCQTS